ncbi:MAG: Uma2 family endonuclease [Lewinellaceae bacterium]|nr:Uma2 family endonuclease [Lewinellaceae bacterium]
MVAFHTEGGAVSGYLLQFCGGVIIPVNDGAFVRILENAWKNANFIEKAIMAIPTQRKLFTVKEYHKMADVGILEPTDRFELIKGEIIKMTPIKSAHSGIVNFLLEYLIIELHQKNTIIGQNPVLFDQYSEPEPDIVVAAYRKDSYRSGHPTPSEVSLIIEVADSSLEYDRSIKKELYAASGIPEYWIINIPDKQLEIYRQPVGSDYKKQETLRPDKKATCRAVSFSIKVKSLFEGI